MLIGYESKLQNVFFSCLSVAEFLMVWVPPNGHDSAGMPFGESVLEHFYNRPEVNLKGWPGLYIHKAAELTGSLMVNVGCHNAFDFAATAYGA